MGVLQGVAMDYLKFHLGPPCPTLSMPCEQATPAFQGWPACKASGLRPSSIPLETPRRTPSRLCRFPLCSQVSSFVDKTWTLTLAQSLGASLSHWNLCTLLLFVVVTFWPLSKKANLPNHQGFKMHISRNREVFSCLQSYFGLFRT
jgi:hypothetical protein